MLCVQICNSHVILVVCYSVHWRARDFGVKIGVYRRQTKFTEKFLFIPLQSSRLRVSAGEVTRPDESLPAHDVPAFHKLLVVVVVAVLVPVLPLELVTSSGGMATELLPILRVRIYAFVDVHHSTVYSFDTGRSLPVRSIGSGRVLCRWHTGWEGLNGEARSLVEGTHTRHI